MLPVLRPHQLVFGSGLITPQPGAIAVIRRRPISIKRIAHVTATGAWVTGDNPRYSTDSRHYGYVELDKIESVIFWRLPF